MCNQVTVTVGLSLPLQASAAEVNASVASIAGANRDLLQQLHGSVTDTNGSTCEAFVSSSASVTAVLTAYEAYVDNDCNLFRHLPQEEDVAFWCSGRSPPPRNPPTPPPPPPLLPAFLTAAASDGAVPTAEQVDQVVDLLLNAAEPLPADVVSATTLPALDALGSSSPGTGDPGGFDKLVNGLAGNQLKGLEPGAEVKFTSETFAVSFARTALPSLDTPLPPGGIEFSTETSPTGISITAAFNDPNALLDGAVSNEAFEKQSFDANPGVPGLQGLGQVDSVMVAWTNNTRFETPPTNASLTRIDSPVTSLTMISGSDVVDMSGTNALVFRSPFSLPNYTAADWECGRPQEACDNETTRLQTLINATEKECELLAKKSVWGGRDKVDACIATYQELGRNLSAHVNDNCKTLPAPCNGRGNCTAFEPWSIVGTCTCDPGWSGAQCDEERLCRFFDQENGTWSTEGCRTLGVTEDWSQLKGSMLCACDHLTDFALASEVFNNPAAFFNSLGSLEINVPIPLSLSEFITAITTQPPMNWVMMGLLLLLMRIGLHYADRVSSSQQPVADLLLFACVLHSVSSR